MSDAQDALQKAVEAIVAEHRGDDDGMVVDWVMVAQTTSFDGDKQQAGYYLGFSGGQLAEHRAIGLLDYGIYLIKFPADE